MHDLYTSLDKVDAADRLLLDMAPDILHNARTRGYLALGRSEALRKQLGSTESETLRARESNISRARPF